MLSEFLIHVYVFNFYIKIVSRVRQQYYNLYQNMSNEHLVVNNNIVFNLFFVSYYILLPDIFIFFYLIGTYLISDNQIIYDDTYFLLLFNYS